MGFENHPMSRKIYVATLWMAEERGLQKANPLIRVRLLDIRLVAH